MIRALRRVDRLIQQMPRRRRVTIALGVVLLAAAFLSRLAASDPDEPSVLVFAPGVALLALELGLVAGAVSGILATGLAYTTKWIQDEPLTGEQVLSRLIPFVLLGALIGLLVDRLRDREQQYRRIVETAHEGIWMTDEHERTTFVNGRVEELLGYTREELLAMPPSGVIDDERYDSDAKVAERRRGQAGQYDIRLRRKDGGEVWVLVSSRGIFDGAGRFVGSLAMLADITARRQAEADLRARDVALVEARAELELHRAAQRQAAEVNDTIVQRLALAKYALAGGDAGDAARRVDEALADAQRIVADLLRGHPVEPGDLRRRHPALIVRDSRE